VVSDDVFNESGAYPKVLVVHLTSQRRPEGPYDWEVTLPRGAAGLSRSCVVKCSEIYTLLKDQLTGRIGALPGSHLAKVDRALAVALGLPFTLIAND
jgi:mRNA-degrading endonuclease toxin of MazEF toxin-antitoxin module